MTVAPESAGGGLSFVLGLRSFSLLQRSFLQLDDATALGGELSGVAKAERLPVFDSDGGDVAIDGLVALVEALVIVC